MREAETPADFSCEVRDRTIAPGPTGVGALGLAGRSIEQVLPGEATVGRAADQVLADQGSIIVASPHTREAVAS